VWDDLRRQRESWQSIVRIIVNNVYGTGLWPTNGPRLFVSVSRNPARNSGSLKLWNRPYKIIAMYSAENSRPWQMNSNGKRIV
jgi:hypothetical protein